MQYQSNQTNSIFDCTKTWYLMPIAPSDEFLGTLQEGQILEDLNYRRQQDYRDDETCMTHIWIADEVNICQELSAPQIFPVKVEEGVQFELVDSDRYWAVSKVTLLKPVNFWELIPNDHYFIGSICIKHQDYIPNKLILPKHLLGNLWLMYCSLPNEIQLPEEINGYFGINYCEIPISWKNRFPSKIEDMAIVSHNFYDDDQGNMIYLAIDLPALDLSKTVLNSFYLERINLDPLFKFPIAKSYAVFYEDQIVSSLVSLPDGFSGILSFRNIKFETAVKLPNTIDGKLVFAESNLSNIVSMPETLNGGLRITNSKIEGILKMPSQGYYMLELNEGTDLSKFHFTDDNVPFIKFLDAEESDMVVMG